MSKSVDDILAKFAIQILGQSTGATSFGAEDFNVKQAFCTDLIELIPQTVDTSKYSCDDSEHSFGLGYIQANLELEAKIKDYLGIEDVV